MEKECLRGGTITVSEHLLLRLSKRDLELISTSFVIDSEYS